MPLPAVLPPQTSGCPLWANIANKGQSRSAMELPPAGIPPQPREECDQADDQEDESGQHVAQIASSELHVHVQCTVPLDVAVGHASLQQSASTNKLLETDRYTCFIVKLGFHVMNCVGRLNIETYSLAIEGLDKNLHCVVSKKN
eukprot:CAMPEP_0174303612 /NCGR_PEP_ID=MMETSP0809-20121228/60289_1 /TAXON_ID=73025 ORGANISM="Eutreptiella gymnastica-like, Strain CCMP1594" /NCGR_SAMPLE_ID=MMETSP0809 /ASSEMBLY_ACC=CAM_ASM_000658 /LENGTH=143 /DNA_ID=CAMNT_0015409669 /DNA_START=1300 /DNA_END=1729 /DNA_ORIENTATION=-